MRGGPLLVTGSTGFVGSYLVPALLAEGHAVRALVRDPARGAALETAGATLVRGDLTDPDSLRAALRGASAVIHLAAVGDSSDPGLNERVNVDGTRHLAAAMGATGVRRIVNVSTTCASRVLRDAYGETKLRAEQEIDHASELLVTHLRPAMIYGRGSKEWDLFALAVRRLPRVPLPGGGRFLLRPVFIGDFLSLVLGVLRRDVAVGRTYDVAGPTPLPAHELVEALGRAQGLKRRALSVPASPVLLGARLLGRLLAHPPVNVDQVMAFLQDTVVDIEPARRELGWIPRPLHEGLAELYRGRP